MTMMQDRDRRVGMRIPVDVFVTHYIKDRPHRALAVNLSPSGVFVHRARLPHAGRHTRNRFAMASTGPIGLELALPAIGETIWARGEICYETPGQLVSGAGIRFTGIPRVHARMLRDYCFETRRAELDRLRVNLSRVRGRDFRGEQGGSRRWVGHPRREPTQLSAKRSSPIGSD